MTGKFLFVATLFWGMVGVAGEEAPPYRLTKLISSLSNKKIETAVLGLRGTEQLAVDLLFEPKGATAEEILTQYDADYALTLGQKEFSGFFWLDGKTVGDFNKTRSAYIGITTYGDLKFFEYLEFETDRQWIAFCRKNDLRHLFPTGQNLVYERREEFNPYASGISLYLADSALPRIVLGVKKDKQLDFIVFSHNRKEDYSAPTLEELIFLTRHMGYKFAFNLYSGSSGTIGYRDSSTDLKGRTDFFISTLRTETGSEESALAEGHYFLIFRKAVKSGSGDLLLRLDNVCFDFNSHALRAAAQNEVRKYIPVILKYQSRGILINGYTDNIGDDAVNLKLSEKRALAVKAFLLKNGVQEKNLVCQGRGKADFIAPNTNEAGRRRNRRVEVTIKNE